MFAPSTRYVTLRKYVCLYWCRICNEMSTQVHTQQILQGSRTKLSYSYTGAAEAHVINVCSQNNFIKGYFTKSNARHVCTYLNSFPAVILNIVTKFNNVEILENLLTFWTLPSAHACHVVCVKLKGITCDENSL